MRGELFYADFLRELRGLDAFLAERRSGGAGLPPREDPDVRRLLEALAYFSARTQSMARQGMFDAVRRLVGDQLEFATRPLPAAALVQVVASGSKEPVRLTQGTPLRVEGDGGMVAHFSLARTLELWPIAVTDARLWTAEQGGLCLGIELASPLAIDARLTEIALYVDELSDFRESLRLLRRLERGAGAVRVIAGVGLPPRGREAELGAGARGTLAFGAPALPEGDDALHPVERVRSHFHQPEQDTFVTLGLGGACGWRVASVVIELTSRPDEPALRIGRGTLKPFVVPLVNRIAARALPIACDGSADSYSIRYPLVPSTPADPAPPVRFLSVRGVYEIGKEGAISLRSSALGPRSFCYELDDALPSEGGPRLRLAVDGSARSPRTIEVDANWYQPAFDAARFGRLRIRPQARTAEGLEFRVLGEPVAAKHSPLEVDPIAQLELLALRGRTSFEARELNELMRHFGADAASRHAAVVDLLERVEQALEPLPRAAGTSLRQVYSVWPAEREPELAPLVEDWLSQLERVLDAWGRHAVRLRRRSVAAERVQAARGASHGLVRGSA